MAEKNLQISDLCDVYGALLPEKQRVALELYYNEDLSLSEIAEQTGISRQGVRDQIKHAESELYKYEQALKLCHKTKKELNLLDRLSKLSKELENKELSEICSLLLEINE